ncbi:hypothetical protein O0I10_007527 [Lichtheimia ornata]|uniref:DM2 domain-containing protein n=1 Tax=Lichtheimia ornata TaxID=688661 RepID=A0AAD7V0N2_9FUNG|nr:uncharacterized protein O0I10_007527 [Lichtheimia ornata]KAJ8656680.1 hypothetical protein O0I10_007527 [Lichtheimia ornata]
MAQQLIKTSMEDQSIESQFQYRKRPGESELLLKHVKKKRPSDRNMPPRIETLVPESTLYRELAAFDKKLDTTILRKRLDVQEALGKPNKTRRILRIFVSHTTARPRDQSTGDGDFDVMDGIVESSWTLKIEGRLLDPPIPTKKAQPVQKFTSFFRTICVELNRESGSYSEDDLVEWRKQPNGPEHDGVEISRRGQSNVNVRIVLDPDYIPQKYRLSPMLSEILDMKLETKPQVIMGLWNYIKVHGLQDTEDKHTIHCDEQLQKLFDKRHIHFSEIPMLIGHHLVRPDPIVINYTITMDTDSRHSLEAYDLDVELDSIIRQKMIASVASTQAQKEVLALDDKIVQCVQNINNSKSRRDFLLHFAQHPVNFINKWIATQTRDLEAVVGDSKIGIEEMRHAEFYKQAWVKEAVFHYLTTKVQQRMQQLLNTKRMDK